MRYSNLLAKVSIDEPASRHLADRKVFWSKKKTRCSNRSNIDRAVEQSLYDSKLVLNKLSEIDRLPVDWWTMPTNLVKPISEWSIRCSVINSTSNSSISLALQSALWPTTANSNEKLFSMLNGIPETIWLSAVFDFNPLQLVTRPDQADSGLEYAKLSSISRLLFRVTHE